MEATESETLGSLHRRPAAATTSSLPSLSGTEPPNSRSSSFSDDDSKKCKRNESKDSNVAQSQHSSGGTLFKTVSFIADPRRRFSRQSSLSWGHKPSPMIGASCFLFLTPIPFLLRIYCYIPAFFLACVTVSSYLSDHCYTGLESGWHTVDRILAPMALSSNMYNVYSEFGLAWASLSIFPILCHLLANHCSKRGEYDWFVIWHSLWHALGAGLIVVCCIVNYDNPLNN